MHMVLLIARSNHGICTLVFVMTTGGAGAKVGQNGN